MSVPVEAPEDHTCELSPTAATYLLRARRWEFVWLCGLVLSFAYERPLAVLTSYDRINPRAFHVFLLVGILVTLRNHRQTPSLPRAFHIWKLLVLWFCVCAIVWTLFLLPWDYGRLSLFFAAEYLIGLMAVYMALRIPLDERQKRVVMIIGVLGGIFVSLYCLHEFRVGMTALQITNEKTVLLAKGTLLGPLGSTYFHLVQYQCLSFCLACMLIPMSHGRMSRVGWTMLALFIAWPLLACGSRTGLGLLAISFVMLFAIERRIRKVFVTLSFVCVVTLSFTGTHILRDAFMLGLTAQRLAAFREGDNSIGSRMSVSRRLPLDAYKWEGASMPLIGAGFYVAPIYDTGSPHYRVDYGVHNIYLFVFEQAGAVGALLFVAFLANALKGFGRIRMSAVPADRLLAGALLAFLAASLIVGFAGQIFWRGFGTVNFNNYLILMLMIALRPVNLFGPTDLARA